MKRSVVVVVPEAISHKREKSCVPPVTSLLRSVEGSVVGLSVLRTPYKYDIYCTVQLELRYSRLLLAGRWKEHSTRDQ